MCTAEEAMHPFKTTRDMAEAQRSFELRKVFAPEQLRNAGKENDFNDELNSDGALDAYAETIVWRLRAAHVMVSLVDRGHQYFIAGALRQPPDPSGGEPEDNLDVSVQQDWFGCSTVPTPGGLCENTVALDTSIEQYPVFMVRDLSEDERFKDLPVVNGEIASYRFYAGTPITTDHGVNIGSLFLFDDKPRDGLSQSHRQFLHKQATNVMLHLMTKREAAERKRAALMSKGIARFLDMTSRYRDDNNTTADQQPQPPPADPLPEHTGEEEANKTATPAIDDLPAQATVLDKIRMTLDQAAEILRESLEITTGGVVFLDTALSNSEIENPSFTAPFAARTDDELGDLSSRPRDSFVRRGSFQASHGPGPQLSKGIGRSASDQHNKPKILAASVPKASFWDSSASALNAKALATLISSYTKGNVWSIDEEGFFSSFQQINEWERNGIDSVDERRSSLTPSILEKERLEAAMLSEIFPKARQIVFLPLWDASTNRWYSGSFLWSQSAVPVFTVESELTYLSAFTNSMMVEISRLDAITANKMKSDFIGSISHEFRSPLHGILVSAEFLRDSCLDTSQSELVSTIQNCSGTLLDTINHVLDYSKINSFEIASSKEGPPSSQLYQTTNLALLCETVIDGMMAANIFRGASIEDGLSSLAEAHSPNERRDRQHNTQGPEIILDFEQRDWNFKVEAGAIQRIIMNLVGNAQKFTTSGFIIVQLRVVEQSNPLANGPPRSTLVLRIKDSGKGMSTAFMEKHLYHPFAQEDSFVPGVGLGLSIVWSIINQLGGKIEMKSEVGMGTDVVVTLALDPVDAASNNQNKGGDTTLPDADLLLAKIRKRAHGKSISFSRFKSADCPEHRDLSWQCVENYLSGWFGFEVKQSMSDVVITNQFARNEYTPGQRSVILHEEYSKPIIKNEDGRSSLSNPIGPFKLGRCMLALLDQELVVDQAAATVGAPTSTSDMGTQTPIGSPEERLVMNGIIMTDYGFSSTPASSFSSNRAPTPQISSQNDETDPSIMSGPSAVGMTLTLPIRKALLEKQTSTIPSIITADATTTTEVMPPLVIPQSIPVPSSPPKSPLPPTSSYRATGTSTPGSRPVSVSVKDMKRSLRVLAVDDNTLNLQLLHRYLLKRKQDVIVTAINGVEAVDAVRNGPPFDVVFMDISMPEMDGFEATRLIRSYERSLQHRSVCEVDDVPPVDSDDPVLKSGQVSPTSLPQASVGTEMEERRDEPVGEREEDTKPNGRAFIVALTGLASRRDRNEAEQSGFDDFLTKPVSFKRIGELLDRLSWEK